MAKIRKLVVPITNMRSKPDKIQQPSKKRKIGSGVFDVDSIVLVDGTSPKPWLPLNGIELTQADKTAIVSGDQLTDKHINFAQEIMKKQFSNIGGLEPTYYLPVFQNTPYRGSRALQVIHCRDNYWIVASSLGYTSEVGIFDSVFSAVDEVTMKLVTQLFGPDVAIKMEGGPKQDGGSDCGVFAIATSTAQANGYRSGKFIQGRMRAHLVNCFESLSLTVFPAN